MSSPLSVTGCVSVPDTMLNFLSAYYHFSLKTTLGLSIIIPTLWTKKWRLGSQVNHLLKIMWPINANPYRYETSEAHTLCSIGLHLALQGRKAASETERTGAEELR